MAAGASGTVKEFAVGFGKTGIAVKAGGTGVTGSGTVLLFFIGVAETPLFLLWRLRHRRTSFSFFL